MKKNLLINIFLILVFTVSTNVIAQVLLEENFDYTAGDLLTDHGWASHSGGGINPVLVTSPGLVFPGQPGSGIGNAALLGNNGEDVNKSFPFVFSGAVYTSVMVAVNVGGGGGYFFHYDTSPTSFSFRGRVFRDDDASNVAFGLSFSSGGGEVYTGFNYNFGETYLLILKYEVFLGTDNDMVSLYIFDSSNPPPTIEPGTPTLGPFPAGGAAEINPGTLSFRQFNAAEDIIVDGILVSTIWLDVVPVELTSFTASVIENNVTLNWITATELNNSGFDVLRSTEETVWEKIGFVAGFGTTTEIHSYSFVDENLASGQYTYRLKQVDYDGTFELSDVINVEVTNPVKYNLSQNYPNPFNPSTAIKFSLAEGGNVTLNVYNTLGEEVALLVNQIMESGTHEVNFDALNLNSGIYFYRIEAGDFSQVKKMTLLK